MNDCTTPEGLQSMILRQFLHQDPVGLSYLIGCGGRGVAAVVDPAGDVGSYPLAAQTGGMAIAYVIDSHLHADHVSVGPMLARRTGAESEFLVADLQ